MTEQFGLILSILILACGIAITIIPFFSDLKSESYPKRKFPKNLTRAGYILLFISLMGFVGGVFKISDDNNSLRKSFGNIRTQNDTNTEKIIKHTQPRVAKALLDMCLTQGEKNPLFTNQTDENNLLTFRVCNLGNEVATNIEDNLVAIILDEKGNPDCRVIKGTVNIYSTIQPNGHRKNLNYQFGLPTQWNLHLQPIYFSLKIYYTNESSKERKLFRKVFKMVSRDQIGDASTVDFEKVNRWLTERGLW